MDDGNRGSAPRRLRGDRWLPIEGYESLYAVSSCGMVKSVRNGRIMAPVLDTDGYPTVKLYRAGTGTRFKVHRLVCRAFHGPSPDNCEVGHLDGSKTNACADNLAWITRSENVRQAQSHGTYRGFTSPAGEDHPRARLSREDVIAIRSRYASGDTPALLAPEFGVTPRYIHDIVSGRRWQNV